MKLKSLEFEIIKMEKQLYETSINYFEFILKKDIGTLGYLTEKPHYQIKSSGTTRRSSRIFTTEISDLLHSNK